MWMRHYLGILLYRTLHVFLKKLYKIVVVGEIATNTTQEKTINSEIFLFLLPGHDFFETLIFDTKHFKDDDSTW